MNAFVHTHVTKLKTWSDWEHSWSKATNETALTGLLHSGFAFELKPEEETKRLCRYLSTADSQSPYPDGLKTKAATVFFQKFKFENLAYLHQDAFEALLHFLRETEDGDVNYGSFLENTAVLHALNKHTAEVAFEKITSFFSILWLRKRFPHIRDRVTGATSTEFVTKHRLSYLTILSSFHKGLYKVIPKYLETRTMSPELTCKQLEGHNTAWEKFDTVTMSHLYELALRTCMSNDPTFAEARVLGSCVAEVYDTIPSRKAAIAELLAKTKLKEEIKTKQGQLARM
ncbi:MAG: hypothetical protein ACI9H6_000467 [Patiriisocius sp.]|jgi:hypothetical protein